MAKELSVAELVQEILTLAEEIKILVNEIPVNKAPFLKVALFLMELKPLISDAAAFHDSSVESIRNLVEVIRTIHGVTKQCHRRSRMFLLYRSQDMIKDIQAVMKSLAHSVQHMLESADTPREVKAEMMELHKKLEDATFFPDSGNEELAVFMSEGISEGNTDEQFATNLLEKISRHLNVSLSALKLELVRDKRATEAEGRQAEMLEMEKLLLLFENAVMHIDAKTLAFEDPFRAVPIPSSFLCPITGQLMQEPVLVEGGLTYEKSAILEWFRLGNYRCPTTNVELKNLDLVPNRSMENAIRQYLDRLNIEKLTQSIKRIKLQPAEVKEAIDTIKELIELNSSYIKHAVSLDGLQPLVIILRTSESEHRRKVLQILSIVAAVGGDYKVRIIKAGAVPVLLWILRKCHGHNPDAVHVLLEISEIQEGKTAILAEQGSIISIASAVNIDSTEQKIQAKKLLDNICHNNSWVVIEAASTGLFHPLVTHLCIGNETVKLEMAEAISTKLELNDNSSAALVSAGAVPPLLKILQDGAIDSKIAAARALHKLSGAEKNTVVIAKAGAIPVLVRYLTLSVKDLKVHIMGTLANLATDQQGAAAIDQEGAVSRLLGMVENGDLPIQDCALKILHILARDSKTVRLSIITESKTVRYILALLRRCSDSCRLSTLGLIFELAADRDTRDVIKPSADLVRLFVNLLEQGICTEEKESALGILAGMTKTGQTARRIMISEGLYGSVIKCLETGSPTMKETAAAVLSRLADPSLSGNVQQVHSDFVRFDVMHSLKEILENGSDRAKLHATANLAVISRRTPSLTAKQSFFKRFLSRLGLKEYRLCSVHAGKCSPRTSFCLVEAGVLPLLINQIRNNNPRNAEKALDAVLTLVEDDRSRTKGVDFLVKNNIINPVVGVVGKSTKLTDKAVYLLERIYRCRKYRDDRYSKVAKSSLCTTMTSGSIEARRSAAKALVHLGMMPKGSTYTADSSKTTDK